MPAPRRTSYSVTAEWRSDVAHIKAVGGPDQRGRGFGAGDILLRAVAQQGPHGLAVSKLCGIRQRQIAGLGGKRRARKERHAQQTRENHGPDVHDPSLAYTAVKSSLPVLSPSLSTLGTFALSSMVRRRFVIGV